MQTSAAPLLLPVLLVRHPSKMSSAFHLPICYWDALNLNALAEKGCDGSAVVVANDKVVR
jgi:hypothetical protein